MRSLNGQFTSAARDEHGLYRWHCCLLPSVRWPVGEMDKLKLWRVEGTVVWAPFVYGGLSGAYPHDGAWYRARPSRLLLARLLSGFFVLQAP